MITIKNLRNAKPQEPWDIRVDRASVLGNPFKMDNENDRDIVCERYEMYFKGMTSNNETLIHEAYEQDNYCLNARIATNIAINGRHEEFMNELRRLYRIHKQYGKLNLFCWCAPKRCHAETIKKFLEKYLEVK